MNPILIRRGAVIVKIYRHRYAGKVRYEIRYRFGDRTHRFKRSSRIAAILLAETAATAIANGQTARLTITDEQALDLDRAMELLAPTGQTILQAAAAVRAQWDAVRNIAAPPPGPRVSEVVELFIAAKRAKDKSPYHIRDFEQRLRLRFAADFQLPITDITTADLETWLNALGVSPRTWNNYRNAIAALFKFAESRKHIPAGTNPTTLLEPIKLRTKTSAQKRDLIFTVNELQDLLTAAPERILPAIALGAFAGCRSEEIRRLTWEDFHWDEPQPWLRLEKNITKNNRDRDVPILPALADWLAPWKHSTGPVCDYANLSVGKTNLARRLGRTWRRNGLRHSFLSYAFHQIAENDLARFAGTSVSLLHSTYKGLVRPEEAAKWFGIRPKTVTSGILNLKFG